MRHITITTDFGSSVGSMRGVIWNIAPEATIADITSKIPPQDINYAAWYLDHDVWYFPAGTIHIVVVDPGVGTARRPIAVQIGEHYFVGPDNGVFSKLYQTAEKNDWPIRIFHTNKPEYWWKLESNIFHGRDIFSPVAAHLAADVPIEELGEEIHDEIRIPVPEAVFTNTGADGEVILIYPYLGNITTNIHHRDLPADFDFAKAKLQIGDRTIMGIGETFGEAETDELIALYGTAGYIIVAVVNGNAYDLLKTDVGDKVRLIY
ncbi:MAG: SAM-dependent chlorinase/fluorinase [Chloroflexota bacterium]